MRAAKSLITSKGPVASGGSIPDGLEDGELDRIKAAGGILASGSGVSSAPVDPPAATPERADQIGEIIKSLTDDEFLADGKPDVRAINKAMSEGSEPVSAAERDAVWAEVKPEE